MPIVTSSRKIIIGRQTRDVIKWNSWITLSQSIPYQYYPAWEETWDVIWTVTLSDQVGGLFFQQVWDWVRIPLQWKYRFTVKPDDNCYSATNTVVVTVKIKVNGVEKRSHVVASMSDEDTFELILWKFDIITLTIALVANGNSSRDLSASVIIQQL